VWKMPPRRRKTSDSRVAPTFPSCAFTIGESIRTRTPALFRRDRIGYLGILCVVKRIDATEVIQAIDHAREREPGGALAFDGDGTLWSGDIGEDLFHALATDVRDFARPALVREATEAGIDSSGSASAIVQRLHGSYLAGGFPEERMCEIMVWIAAGRTRAELDGFCAALLNEVHLRDRLHAEAIAVVEHARRVGLETFLVSASPRPVVEQGARVVGIPVANVIAATEVQDSAGVVQCAVVRPIPYGEGKATHLAARLGQRPLYAAFGDNAFDVNMLRYARIPVAVRPKARLLARAEEVPGFAVLAELPAS
jgi:phosphatidylglycerophosphatase C